jgi:hypothetical protein
VSALVTGSTEPPARRRSSSAAALLTVLATVLGLAISVLASAPANGQNVRVRHSFFGMHDGSTSSLTSLDDGSIRLWDAGVQWRDIEVTRGHYDWTRLDALVTAAQHAHAEVLMVVAMTPRFYASKPTQPPSSLKPYKRFVHALMKRYRSFHGSRGIAAYQAWNEPNIVTFYSGTMSKMARMTRAMAAVRHTTDRHALVVAPSMVTRLRFEQKAIGNFYRQRVDGRAVWRYVDATAFSLYPVARTGGRINVPEDSMKLLSLVRRVLHRAGVPRSKPLWNTEINYGLEGGTKPAAHISTDRQAANVMRTYLLNAAAGVKRTYWYRYDLGRFSSGGTLANTLLADPSTLAVTDVGRVFLRAQKWMHGSLIGPSKKARPCQHNRRGTYSCVVRDASGTRHIYWNPFRTGSVRLPKGVHHLQGVLGAISSVKPRQTIKVGYKPVMVYH